MAVASPTTPLAQSRLVVASSPAIMTRAVPTPPICLAMSWPTTVSLATTPGGNVAGAHNLVGTAALPIDPKLGPLSDNGGLTKTHALLPGGPAIDAGANVDGLAFDQRGNGFARVAGGAADIGAYER